MLPSSETTAKADSHPRSGKRLSSDESSRKLQPENEYNNAASGQTRGQAMNHLRNSCLPQTTKLSLTPVAVILISALVSAQHQSMHDIGGQNQQLVQHHQSGLSHRSTNNVPFMDLSGPTSGKIQTLDVICGKNFMTVRAEFSGPFYGIVFSKGTYGQENCIYVKPNSGLTHAAFNVYYDQCGTKPDLQGKFYENTIVIQYGSDIIEAYDEAKRLRCEWFEAYEKPATFKPAIPVADLEVVEMNFQGDDIDCWMEIQEGSGPWSREVSKIVPVGQPMTIVVAINDYNGQFDMRVKSCVAHDGVQQPIALTDEYGCVLRPKMLTPFAKIKNPGGHKKATVLSYSRFLAFKFPDSMNVQIQCTVEVCRHGCAEACQRIPSAAATTLQPELSLTARWPQATSNQVSMVENPPSNRLFPSRQQVIAGASESVAQYRPASRVQFSGDRLTPASNQQPLSAPVGPRDSPANEFEQQRSYLMRRPQQDRSTTLEQPRQYLVPQSSRRSASSFSQKQRSPSTAAPIQQTSSITPSTTVSTSPTSSRDMMTSESARPDDGLEVSVPNDEMPAESNRIGAPSEQVSPGPKDVTSSTDPQEVTETSTTDHQSAGSSQSATSAINHAQDSKSEASQVNPSLIDPEQTSAQTQSNQEQPRQQQSSTDQPSVSVAPIDESLGSGPSEPSKPSVQDEEEQENAERQSDSGKHSAFVQSSPEQSAAGSSSLKTVEVEIPASDDSSRGLLSGVVSPINGNHPVGNQFNSVRLSSVDLSSSYNGNGNHNYQDNLQETTNSRMPIGNDKQSIHGQEQVERRDKGEESNIEAIMANSKVRFGARSQPNYHHSIEHHNHQMPRPIASLDHHDLQPTDTSSIKESSDLQKSLLDRSDESSLIEIASSNLGQSHDSSPGKPSPVEVMDTAASSVDENQAAMASSTKQTKPVVGTEELASGPVQIEDRIGAQPDGLEETLQAQQQQQQSPQSAALIASNQTSLDTAPLPEEMHRSDSQVFTDMKLTDMRADQSSSGHNPRLFIPAVPAASQPFPNVQGQAKVIPDPSASNNQRIPLMAQASSETISNAVPSVSIIPLSFHDQLTSKPAASDANPVAQITNLPINIGFPQGQLPNIQQLGMQQLAFIQQQQQAARVGPSHQQQAILKTTTAKPARGRFGLLSPQAAFQAVASRLLPKSLSQHAYLQTQSPLQSQHQQQAIQNLLNMTPEQQKLLTLTAKQQPQYFFPKQLPQQSQFPHIPSRLGSPIVQPIQHQYGLNGRSNNLQPLQAQPLVRSRRSAIKSNGERGKGEIGMTKTFMVVTGLDLAFSPNSSDTELPPIFEGRRIEDDEAEVIYGICMPVVSLTFVLTCILWLILFVASFCVYMLIKSRRQNRSQDGLK